MAKGMAGYANAALPPKPEKLTVKSILEKRRTGAALTPEEQEIYNGYREKRNEKLREYNRECQRNRQRELRQAETEEDIKSEMPNAEKRISAATPPRRWRPTNSRK